MPDKMFTAWFVVGVLLNIAVAVVMVWAVVRLVLWVIAQ